MGRTASAETDVTLRAEILSYSRSRGLFAGISLAGSTLRADNDANKKLYGKDVSAQDIVFKERYRLLRLLSYCWLHLIRSPQ